MCFACVLTSRSLDRLDETPVCMHAFRHPGACFSYESFFINCLRIPKHANMRTTAHTLLQQTQCVYVNTTHSVRLTLLCSLSMTHYLSLDASIIACVPIYEPVPFLQVRRDTHKRRKIWSLQALMLRCAHIYVHTCCCVYVYVGMLVSAPAYAYLLTDAFTCTS